MYNNAPFLSIIVPIYNVELYLRACLDSILQQDFQDYELILINDGSQDSSLAICESYAALYSQIMIIDQANKGLSGARNAGLLIAKGQYVWFVDSDDLIERGALQRSYDEITSSNCEVLAFSSKHLIDESKDLRDNPVFPSAYFDNINDFLSQCPLEIAPWIYIIKRELLIVNSLTFKENIKIHEDEFFVIDVFSHAQKIRTLSEGLYIYRIRPNSLMRSNRVCDQLFAFAELVLFYKSKYSSCINQEFWNDKMYVMLNRFYAAYFFAKKSDICNVVSDSKFEEIRSIKMDYNSRDVKGIKLMKWLHNNLFFIYKMRIQKG